MPRYRWQVLSALIAVAAGNPPSAGYALTGAELNQACLATTTACIFYLRGFVDGIAIGSATARPGDRLFCQPSAGLAVEQAKIVVEKLFREHPEALDREAGLLVGAALIDAFRCH